MPFIVKEEFFIIYILICEERISGKKISSGSTEIWTRIAGFRVLSANHYTIEPIYNIEIQQEGLISAPNKGSILLLGVICCMWPTVNLR